MIHTFSVNKTKASGIKSIPLAFHYSVITSIIVCMLFLYQLNDCLNFSGERFVFALNNLLNDCECSKPSS